MNTQLLQKHIKKFISESEKNPQQFLDDKQERIKHNVYYQSCTKEKIRTFTNEDIYSYLSPLWAMRIWGNKHYVVDKAIADNGLEPLKDNLINLIWSDENIETRWDSFRKNVKGIGPGMMSELLCKTFPDRYLLWNRRAYISLRYLQVDKLPKYDYQLNGSMYKSLCDVGHCIADYMKQEGFEDGSLLAVDYFLWAELQVEENLRNIHTEVTSEELKPVTYQESEFIHNEIRDKLADIGKWLGFNTRTEQKVSEGSKVDTIWEATIGNMGRVIYIFEVQTKGSIDSLMLNLLKSLNNPAVQGIVAVSDKEQIERIKKHASDVQQLKDKLKYWDYKEILEVYESLESVNISINDLGLVPQGF